MVRNVSFKTDDEFDDRLYSESKKKGMTKSAFIKHELSKIISNEGSQEVNQQKKEMNDSNVNLVNENTEKKNVKEVSTIDLRSSEQISEIKKEEEKISEDANQKPFFSPNRLNSLVNDKTKDDTIPNITHVEPAKIKEKIKDIKEIKEEKKTSSESIVSSPPLTVTTSSSSSASGTPDIKAIDFSSLKETNSNTVKPIANKQPEIKQQKNKKFIRKVNRVNSEEGTYTSGVSLQEEIRKEREREKFNDRFESLTKHVENIHGKAETLDNKLEKLNNIFSDIHTKTSKIDTICKDGECIKADIGDLKKNFDVLNESRKSNDSYLNEFKKSTDTKLSEIDKKFEDLKKAVPKTEVCPHCGNPSLLHMASFCSDCGGKIEAWADDNGNKIENWKPYYMRNKK